MANPSNFTQIELFAGCGGMALGFKAADFDMVMANELSPMAAETFAYNFLGDDLEEDAKSPSPNPKHTKWLSSQYPLASLSKRLREDPRDFPDPLKLSGDVKGAQDLERNLIVGSIVHLNNWLEHHQDILANLKDGFGRGGVDVVTGGPPCQSFSLAGLREFKNHRNKLPWEFARFVEMVQPRFALLENVTGILRPFQDQGKPVHAWREVAKAFARVGYVPLCLHVNAKFAGVAQNRPRFIMVAFRKDVLADMTAAGQFNSGEEKMLAPSWAFYHAASQPDFAGKLPTIEYFDAADDEVAVQYFESSGFLRHLVARRGKHTSVRAAIDDLKAGGDSPSTYAPTPYADGLGALFGSCIKHPEASQHREVIPNHEKRNNSGRVVARFRVYQILQELAARTDDAALIRSARKEISGLISDDEENKNKVELSEGTFRLVQGMGYVTEDGKRLEINNNGEFVEFLKTLNTKKQTQRALDGDAPAPAALSIPDDACHYDPNHLRTLSVREMARIQSFPDKFVFRSKVTTGGQMRKFEVPQYTQVGNAVPPLLAYALGQMMKELLQRADQAAEELRAISGAGRRAA